VVKEHMSCIAKLVWLVPFLMACNNGGSNVATYAYLQVTPNIIPPVYRANIGESASMVFSNTIVTNSGSPQARYDITAVTPNSNFSILVTESGNNGCRQVSANQTCNITIVFTPSAESNYSTNNLMQFTVGSLESTVNVVTTPF